MLDQLAGFRRAFRYGAIGCSIVSASLAAIFGLYQSPQWFVGLVLSVFLMLISFSADYIWLFVADAMRKRQWYLGGGLVAGGIVVLSLNILSHLGSVGWHRDMSSNEANVTNVRFDLAADQVKDSRASLALFSKQLADLEAANAWAATVTPDGLKAMLPTKDEAISQEENRGGCARRCLALKKEKAELEGRVAIAEQRVDLTRRIEATQRILASHRDKASHSDRKVAASSSQAAFFASMATASLDPSAEAQTWTTRAIASWIAVALCLAPILFGLVGWGIGHGMPSGAPGSQHANAGGNVNGHTTSNSGALVPNSPAPAEPGQDRMTLVQQTFNDARFARSVADLLKSFQGPQARAA